MEELEKDPKFRKWIVEIIGMKWRNYVLSKEDVRHALRNIYLEMKYFTKKEVKRKAERAQGSVHIR